MKKLLVSLALAAFAAPAFSQTAYPLFGPVDGILVGDEDTYQTSAADSSDVISLWTGCSGVNFLRSDGTCAVPSGPTPAALTRVDDTNVTLTLGGSPSTSLLAATSLTLGWNGQLAVGRGGTGASSLSGLLKGNGTSAFSAAAAADVYGLWSGTCNSSTFLRGDGSCQSPGGGGTVTSIAAGTGISASPSSPITSSGTLAIDFTGNYTWSGTASFTSSFTIPRNNTNMVLRDTGGSASDMTAYISLQDSASSERGWMGYGNGNTTLTLSNSIGAIELNGSSVTASGVVTATPRLQTNLSGVRKGYMHSAASTNDFCNGTVANDLCVGTASGKIVFTDDDGSTAGMVFDGGALSTATVSATTGTFTNATVGGSNVCRADGTNCPASSAYAFDCTTVCNLSGMTAGQSARIRKTSDTSRASTTALNNDAALSFTNVPAGNYAMVANLYWSGGAGGVKHSWGATGGVVAGNSILFYAQGPAAGSCQAAPFTGISSALSDGTFETYNCTSLGGSVATHNFPDGMNQIRLSGAGTLALYWAQNSSNGTATVLEDGSWVTLMRIN